MTTGDQTPALPAVTWVLRIPPPPQYPGRMLLLVRRRHVDFVRVTSMGYNPRLDARTAPLPFPHATDAPGVTTDPANPLFAE